MEAAAAVERHAGPAVLQRVLKGRITFTPLEDGTGYEFEAQTRFDGLFTGIAVPIEEAGVWVKGGNGRGMERMEAQLSELLEGAQKRLEAKHEAHRRGKGGLALRGFEPRFDG